MFKRVVVAVFVSALATFGLAPAASATSESSVVKVVKVKPGKAIDWDAPPVQNRIDWD